MTYMKIENPGGIEVSLTFTLKIEDWLKMRDYIREGKYSYWPTSLLFESIGDMVSKVEKEFYPG